MAYFGVLVIGLGLNHPPNKIMIVDLQFQFLFLIADEVQYACCLALGREAKKLNS